MSISPDSVQRSTRASPSRSSTPSAAPDIQSGPLLRLVESKLFRTSTFRLALLYLLLFLISTVLVFGYIYWATAGYLGRQTDVTVETEIKAFAEEYRDNGMAGVVQLVIFRSRDPQGSLYLVTDNQNNVLAGNLEAWPHGRTDPDGWFEFAYDRPGLEGAETRQGRGRYVEFDQDFRLFVGRDIQDRLRTEYLITTSLVWAMGLTVALGLIGGLFLSRNMLARVDAINRTSRDIMHGDLSSRLPVHGSGDELDQLAENLNDMLDQIERLMVGMRQVTANIAHDLRSPLNRLRNRVEVALMHPRETQEYRDALAYTIEEADGLLKTFNAMLLIERTEAGTSRETMSEVDLSSVVLDAIELYEPFAEEQEVELTCEVADGLHIHGNRELLAQALANLLDNALKYTPKGGRVSVVASRRAGHIELTVSDTGPGIPFADRARVFDRFVRLEASRNTPGSGLGLSLVAAVARLHGATIDLGDNRPGLKAVLTF